MAKVDLLRQFEQEVIAAKELLARFGIDYSNWSAKDTIAIGNSLLAVAREVASEERSVPLATQEARTGHHYAENGEFTGVTMILGRLTSGGIRRKIAIGRGAVDIQVVAPQEKRSIVSRFHVEITYDPDSDRVLVKEPDGGTTRGTMITYGGVYRQLGAEGAEIGNGIYIALGARDQSELNSAKMLKISRGSRNTHGGVSVTIDNWRMIDAMQHGYSDPKESTTAN